MIHRERLTATIDGDFVVFLIGMLLNQSWKVHKGETGVRSDIRTRPLP
jgi:hypothetical protein